MCYYFGHVYSRRVFMKIDRLCPCIIYFINFSPFRSIQTLRLYNISQNVAATRHNTIRSSSDLPLVVILFNNVFPTA